MKIKKVRSVVDWFGGNITVTGVGVITGLIGFAITIYQLTPTPVSAEAGGTTINIDQKHSQNPKNCVATKSGSTIHCIDNHYADAETYKILNTYTGYTHLAPIDKPWNPLNREGPRYKLFNGTKIRVVQQLDNEDPYAAIAVVEVLDGPHKGKQGKINMALVTKN